MIFSSYAHGNAVKRCRREAEVYRLMIDRAPLVFGPSLATRFRRRIAHLLVRLAGRIAPNGAIAIASDRC